MTGRDEYQQRRKEALQAVSSLYFFLFSDAYRELREAEVRCECYAASRYHFDDGARFIIDATERRYPVDDEIWASYGEVLTEIEARIAQAEGRRDERLAALKGVHVGLLRFCEQWHLDPALITATQPFSAEAVAGLDRTAPVVPSIEVASETALALDAEWRRHLQPSEELKVA